MRVQTFAAVAMVLVGLGSARAQQIVVDTTPSHALNSFDPKQTLGAGIDRIPVDAIDHDLTPETLKRVFEAGWQPITYRQNTDLAVEAWHWNPEGTWSAKGAQGYFVGSTHSSAPILHSYGYALPHRGFTRNDGTGNTGFSRLTDGDSSTYWKSNPYLSSRFTHESDAFHPQWAVVDLASEEVIDTIRIDWAAPFATRYLVQYWSGVDPIRFPTLGNWITFPAGEVNEGHGGTVTSVLTHLPVKARFLRAWMTASSNTCDDHGSEDPRNCVGYAIHELYAGTTDTLGNFHDLLRHIPDQEQTTTYVSSVDPWHTAESAVNHAEAQVGFDLFFRSGVTRGLPAMMPIDMLYDNPDNAAAEIRYLEQRKYPISYVEMGEEADGQYMLPEDYGALYLQYADSVRSVDPALKLGGPSFQGVNQDIEVWPDARGRTSWLRRFLDYLRTHQRERDLQFFSFEHYPLEPCKMNWSALYQEPTLVSHIVDVWHNDGLPRDMPLFITETNLSSAVSESYNDNFSGLWLADFVASFLSSGGNGIYYFHDLPLRMEQGCNNSAGTFGMFSVRGDYSIDQPLAQFFASQMINREWLDGSGGSHTMMPVASTVLDGAGRTLVTGYAVRRPDGTLSLMLVNKDQNAPARVRILFEDESSRSARLAGTLQRSTFGAEQYHWHPAHSAFNAHAPIASSASEADRGGHADPDGPIVRSTLAADADGLYTLPPASITVLRGRLQASPTDTR